MLRRCILTCMSGILMTFSTDAFVGLGWNVVGLVTILVWTGVTCFVMFFLLKKLHMLRVEADHEFKGQITKFRH